MVDNISHDEPRRFEFSGLVGTLAALAVGAAFWFGIIIGVKGCL